MGCKGYERSKYDLVNQNQSLFYAYLTKKSYSIFQLNSLPGSACI